MEDTKLNDWSLGKKVAFRFFAAYFLTYLFTSNMGFWWPMVRLAGRLMHLGREITVGPNGSGDTTYNYLQLPCMAFVSAVITILWSVADRKRPRYDELRYWVHVFVRYGLAFYMLSYGGAKICLQQFPFPGLSRLDEPLGSFSPMGLAWTFIGYSPAFNVFTGSLEATGGLLLLFRRTTIFGALFSMTVLCNIVAMNLCYDIPVKLFSMHLLLMTVFIAAPDLNRLWVFFFLSRPVPAPVGYPVFKEKWARVTRILLKGLVMLGFGMVFANEYSYTRTIMNPSAKGNPLYGIYTVERYLKNGIDVPLLTTDPGLWRQLIIEKSNYAVLTTMNDGKIHYELTADTKDSSLLLTDRNGSGRISMHYHVPDSGHMVLKGALHGWITPDSVTITLKKKNLNDFLLISRGFHWVNEYPLNR